MAEQKASSRIATHPTGHVLAAAAPVGGTQLCVAVPWGPHASPSPQGQRAGGEVFLEPSELSAAEGSMVMSKVGVLARLTDEDSDPRGGLVASPESLQGQRHREGDSPVPPLRWSWPLAQGQAVGSREVATTPAAGLRGGSQGAATPGHTPNSCPLGRLCLRRKTAAQQASR